MCVVALAWQVHPEWPLILIGNRDELHARAADPLANWVGDRGIIAGKDLQSGGTWLGVTELGRVAVITNVRNQNGPDGGLRTRGDLVTGALLDGMQSLESVNGAEYNRFNLIVADGDDLSFVSNHPEHRQSSIKAGIFGVSNGEFDEPWPKVNFLKEGLARWLENEDLVRGDPELDSLFALLADEGASGRYEGRLPEDTSLIEARDTPAFVRHPVYGTRCSTVLVVGADGRAIVAERSFDSAGEVTGDVRIPFTWPFSATKNNAPT